MIRQDVKGWNKGRADGHVRSSVEVSQGLDALSYSSGYVEGKAQPEVSPELARALAGQGCAM
jgi:hypothetical protein